MSYDNTIDLGADTWRHVAFIEQRKPLDAGEARRSSDGASALATRPACRPTRTATACAG